MIVTTVTPKVTYIKYTGFDSINPPNNNGDTTKPNTLENAIIELILFVNVILCSTNVIIRG